MNLGKWKVERALSDAIELALLDAELAIAEAEIVAARHRARNARGAVEWFRAQVNLMEVEAERHALAAKRAQLLGEPAVRG